MSARTRALALLATLAAAPPALTAQGLSPSLPMEIYVGRLTPADALDAPSADVAGIRLGVDIGAFTGLRGYYWRGVESPSPVQGYGAEAQVNLNVGNGVTPFLLAGIGRLDFRGEADGDVVPADRTLPLAGGGLRLDVGRLGIQGSLRSHLLRVEREDEGRDLTHSTLWTLGATFRLGRGWGRTAPPPAPAAVGAPVSGVAVARADTVVVVQRDTTPERFVTIPIPREGEIYLRYGPPGEGRTAPVELPAVPMTAAVDEARIEQLRREIVADLEPLLRALIGEEREAMRETVRREVAAVAPGLTAASEARLREQIEATVALRVREELARTRPLAPQLPAPAGPSPAAPLAPAEAGEIAVDGAEPVTRFHPRLRGLRPFAGGNLDRPRQFVTGLRLDLGPFDADRPQIRLVPEAMLGIGQGGTSVMLAANVAYESSPLALRGTSFQPYGYAGAGFIFFGKVQERRPRREAVLNLGYGVLLPIPNHPADFFVEHQGIDLFDLNRVLVGVRF